MMNQTVLVVPEKCICEYDATISAYRCQFDVKNTSNEVIYLNVTNDVIID